MFLIIVSITVSLHITSHIVLSLAAHTSLVYLVYWTISVFCKFSGLILDHFCIFFIRKACVHCNSHHIFWLWYCLLIFRLYKCILFSFVSLDIGCNDNLSNPLPCFLLLIACYSSVMWFWGSRSTSKILLPLLLLLISVPCLYFSLLLWSLVHYVM